MYIVRSNLRGVFAAITQSLKSVLFGIALQGIKQKLGICASRSSWGFPPIESFRHFGVSCYVLSELWDQKP